MREIGEERVQRKKGKAFISKLVWIFDFDVKKNKKFKWQSKIRPRVEPSPVSFV